MILRIHAGRPQLPTKPHVSVWAGNSGVTLTEAQTQTVLGKEAMAVGVTGSDTGWQDRDERRGGAN